MKAIRAHECGGPERVVYEDVLRPEPKEDQLLIRVHAAGVNPADWQILSHKSPKRPFPWTLGFDVSGIVEEMGNRTFGFGIGDAVYGMVHDKVSSLTPAGSYAEYVAAPSGQVSPKPERLDHIKSAALPIVALTAWQALFDAAELTAGQKILIHAAAGGVGHIAVQLAKWKGAYVIGTASAANEAFLRELGVDEFIDYRATRFEDTVQDVDVVLDPFGGEMMNRSLGVLKGSGILVSLKQTPSPEIIKGRGIRGTYILAKSNTAQLAEIAKLVDAGYVKPYIDTVLPLKEARRALELSQKGHTRGKIVLRVSG